MARTKVSNSMPPVSVETLSRRAAKAAMRTEDTARLLASTPQKMATLTRNGVRMFGLLYADASPDFQRLVATRGFRDKVLVEYKPADLGTIKVQMPWDNQWLIVACVDQEYAAGLTMDTHTEITRRLRSERLNAVEIGGERLEQAKAELRELLAALRVERTLSAGSA